MESQSEGLLLMFQAPRIENIIPLAQFLSFEPVIVGPSHHIISSVVVDLECCTHTLHTYTQRSVVAIFQAPVKTNLKRARSVAAALLSPFFEAKRPSRGVGAYAALIDGARI